MPYSKVQYWTRCNAEQVAHRAFNLQESDIITIVIIAQTLQGVKTSKSESTQIQQKWVEREVIRESK